MSFVFRKIFLFSLIPSLASSTSPIVDKSYISNHQDVYDAIVNTLIPILLVIFLNRIYGGDSGNIKKILLPVLDDLLYNTVTWVIPLTVSFAYNDFPAIKIFSLVNMGLNVFFAAIALMANKKIGNVDYDNNNKDDISSGLLAITFFFLVLFPVIV